jgi:hypothetical protein
MHSTKVLVEVRGPSHPPREGKRKRNKVLACQAPPERLGHDYHQIRAHRVVMIRNNQTLYPAQVQALTLAVP